MKFIHVADLHLDSKMDALSGEKAKIRREELFNTFERVADYADNNNVTAIIISGDLFDGKKVYLKSKNRVLHVIKKHGNVDFLYLAGNHDEKDIFKGEDLPENLIVFDDSLQEVIYDNVSIFGKSGNVGIDVYSKSFDRSRINILALHGQLINHSGNLNSEEISLPLLKNKNIDYLALGHLHKFNDGVIDARGKYVYCGCLEGRGFDEIGQKGFVEILVKNGTLNYQFIPFAKREIFEIPFSCDGVNSWFELRDNLVNYVIKNIPQGTIIRVVIEGERNRFEVDKLGLINLLSDRYFYVDVLDKSRFIVNKSDFEFDKSPLGEFVNTVFESDLENLTKNSVIMCGIKALNGEEI